MILSYELVQISCRVQGIYACSLLMTRRIVPLLRSRSGEFMSRSELDLAQAIKLHAILRKMITTSFAGLPARMALGGRQALRPCLPGARALLWQADLRVDQRHSIITASSGA